MPGFPSILFVPSLRRDRRDRKRDKHADSSRNVMAETGPMPSGDLSGELGSSPQSGHLPDTNHIDPFVCLDLPCAKYAAKSILLMCGSLPIASRLAPAPLVKPHMALTWPHDLNESPCGQRSALSIDFTEAADAVQFQLGLVALVPTMSSPRACSKRKKS